MTYSVGNSEVANYANTSSGKVTNVVADDGLGGAGVVTDVTDRVALSFVVATNIQFLTIDVTSLDDYVAGMTDVTITVNAGVYVLDAKLLDLIEQESLLANKEIQDYLSNLIKHSYESIDNGLIEEITADNFNLALELEQRNFIFEIEDFFA